MYRINKETKNNLYMVLAVCFLLWLGLFSNAVAFKNGGGGPRGANAYTAYNYKKDYTSKTYQYYGTHDWIAEKAWDLVFTTPWVGEDGLVFNTFDKKMIFLFATETPDRGGYNRIYTFDKHCGFGVPAGAHMSGLPAPSYHHFYITGNHEYEYYANNQGMAQGAAICYTTALYHLKFGHCEAAAFYMGMMAHLIADVSCYVHLISATLAEHSNFENQVLTKTRMPYFEGDQFFSSNEHGWSSLNLLGSMPGPVAVYLAAPDTYFGETSVSEEKGALFLHNNWLENEDRFYSLPRYWDTIDSVGDNEVLQVIEWDLNRAIFWTASALQNIRNSIDSFDCSCAGMVTYELVRSRIEKKMAEYMRQIVWNNIFAFSGVGVTVLSLAFIQDKNRLFSNNVAALPVKIPI